MQTEDTGDGLIVNKGTMGRRVFVYFMKYLQACITGSNGPIPKGPLLPKPGASNVIHLHSKNKIIIIYIRVN